MKPRSILDRSFSYTPSFETNLKNTFARIRREMREAQAKEEPSQPARPATNVAPITRAPRKQRS
jgi:hypothetical protein